MDVAAVIRAPVVTSAILAISVALIVLTSIDAVHAIQLAYSSTLIFEEHQYWRLLTNFFYQGRFDVNAFFNIMWLHSTSRDIEEEYFFGRPLDYVLTLVAGCAAITGLRVSGAVDLPFLSIMFANMLTYLYSRLGPNGFVNIMGIFTIQMRLLPLAFLALSYALNGVEVVKPLLFADLVGHMLWYLLDLLPRITGFSPFKVQRHLEELFGGRDAHPIIAIDVI